MSWSKKLSHSQSLGIKNLRAKKSIIWGTQFLNNRSSSFVKYKSSIAPMMSLFFLMTSSNSYLDIISTVPLNVTRTWNFSPLSMSCSISHSKRSCLCCKNWMIKEWISMSINDYEIWVCKVWYELTMSSSWNFSIGTLMGVSRILLVEATVRTRRPFRWRIWSVFFDPRL